MTAVEIAEAGGPEQLRPVRTAVPVPGHGQVLIRVAYAGVNRPDVLQRRGLYAPPPGASPLPGLEASGHIAAIGPGVVGLAQGEAVCALLPGGGYAEYALAPAAHVLAVPAGMTLQAAGCLPETAFTVWSNVVQRGGLTAGEVFLVHGGSSGIGTMAIQVAKALGARVFATAGSDAKCAACEALGATAINYREADFVTVVNEAGGADLILDMVGGDYMARNLAAMAEDGRLVMIAQLRGIKTEVNLSTIMRKRLTVTGSTLRPQSDRAKGAIASALRTHLWPMIEGGAVKVLIDSEYPLAEATEAHRRMESSEHIGKIALRVGAGD
ncbi:NAD(P)H-quinone oxidoreductase [Paracoccus suum]|uniref:NAD(P)H-quinone oxidoreductase n=2 Tax=Paracoccus suum TaxID=2259340 RepID=A0A344PNN7_9RHOB|nr:NAD(P)H-quinone oxidoreductase [Paracoccus suum]